MDNENAPPTTGTGSMTPARGTARVFKPHTYHRAVYRSSVALFRAASYRCDSCGVVRVFSAPPGLCACGADPLSWFRLREAQREDFRLPLDVSPGVLRAGSGYVECPPCPYYECWHLRAADCCGLGLLIHTWIDATGTTVIRPPRVCRQAVGEGSWGV